MKQQAIEKLRSEIQAKQSNHYVRFVGNYLIGELDGKGNENLASAITSSDKTIEGSLEVMREEARKQGGRVGVFPPDEGFRIVMNYFMEETADQTDTPEVIHEEVTIENKQTVEAVETVVPIVEDQNEPSPEFFTRNSWFHDETTDAYYEFVKGSEKPVEVIQKIWKTITKKKYDEHQQDPADAWDF